MSGFITGTYVVLTPLITAVVLRERVPGTTWAAVGLATAGLALLSLRGLSVGVGEAITLLAAALYALHIVGLGRHSSHHIATGLSVVQMVVIAVICTIGALPGASCCPRHRLTGPRCSTWWSSRASSPSGCRRGRRRTCRQRGPRSS